MSTAPYQKNGNIGGLTEVSVVTPTVTANSAYTSGNCIGGPLSVTLALWTANSTGILQSIVVDDWDNNSAVLQVDIFSSQPSGTIVDKTAYVLTPTGAASPHLGSVNIIASDYVTAGGLNSATKTGINLPVYGTGGSQTLYAVVSTTSTPTFTATTGKLILKFGFLQD